jgi:hypothetical protein
MSPVDRNTLREPFFTGLAPGPEHDRVLAEGSDFIVFQIETSENTQKAGFEQGPYVIPNCNERALCVLEWTGNWMDWCRVRAMSAEDAIAIYEDARDQCVAEQNSSPQWREVVTLDWDAQEDGLLRQSIIDGGDHPLS